MSVVKAKCPHCQQAIEVVAPDDIAANLYQSMYHLAFDRGLVYERLIKSNMTTNLPLRWRVETGQLTAEDIGILGLSETGYDADHFNKVMSNG